MGEYAVLEGAPAVLVNTKPRFCFKIRKGKNLNGHFHPDSPAGQWLEQHPQIKYSITSYDPHSSQGGFGFSSAQFCLVYFLSKMLDEGRVLKEGQIPEINLLQMWKDYRSLNFNGPPPSGADALSQWVGKVCLFYPEPFNISALDWPFKDLNFFLIRTGVELNTWEHLKEIKSRGFSELTDIVKRAILNVKSKDAKGFVLALNEYSICLEKKSLVHNNTSLLLNKIKKIKSVIAAKGCGAMGAEVVALFFHPKDQREIESALIGYSIIAHREDLTCGVNIHKSKDYE